MHPTSEPGASGLNVDEELLAPPVFSALKGKEQILLTVVKNCSKKELLPVITGQVLKNATVYTDAWKAYDGLILNGYEHYRVFHCPNEFARGKCHINGIESFWSFAKRRLAQFNGIHSGKFILHLKECELSFNNSRKDLFQIIFKQLLKF